MHLRTWLLGVVLAIAAPFTAAAETVLLVPGYLGSVESWRGTAITQGLRDGGWADAGHLMVEEGEGGFLAVDHEGCLRFALPCAALGLPNAIFERKLPVWPHGNAVIFDLKPLAKTDKPGPRA